MTIKIAILFSFVFFLFPLIARAVSYPQPVGYVNDFAHVYSDQFRSQLESDLSQFDQQTGNQLAVATISDLQGEPIEEYAVKLFEQWNVGKKEQDTGLLLLISKNDRQVRIEVGYGLEPTVTDGRAGEIIRTDIAPNFQKGDYEAGTQLAMTDLKALITGGGEMSAPAPAAAFAQMSDVPVGLLLFFGYGLFTYLASFLGRTKVIWPGSLIGAVIGLVAGFFFWAWIGAVLSAVLLGLGGVLLDFVLSRNYQYRASQGLPTGFWMSGGGFRGGGGFGGFGGGRSGGGGASGRW